MAIEPGQPLTITVIMPVRNDLRVTRALDSVLAQDLPDDVMLDIVVVDDSDDDTPALLATYAAARPDRVRLSSTPGGARGIYPARNHGLTLARGSVICTLNADDYYAGPGVLADVAAAFRAAPTLDLVHGQVMSWDELTGRGNPEIPRRVDGVLQREWRFRGGMIPDVCCFWNRAVFDRLGNYREDLTISGDYEFFLRAYTRGLSLHDLGYITTVFTLGGISTAVTPSMQWRLVHESMRSWRGNVFGMSDMLWGLWLIARYALRCIRSSPVLALRRLAKPLARRRGGTPAPGMCP